MDPDDYIEDHEEEALRYRDAEEINSSELIVGLRSLYLLDRDPYLRMQAFNLSMVDQFVMGLESKIRRALLEEDRTPPEAMFLSAISQMWIYAAYELLRTWLERGKEIIKWSQNSGLKAKIAALERDPGFQHFNQEARAEQLRRVQKKPALLDKIKEDMMMTHVLFARLEYLRVALAKHETGKRNRGIADAPGYGPINKWCGSIDYVLENTGITFETISRRDIADELRRLSNRQTVPTDNDNRSFDEAMNEFRSYNPFDAEKTLPPANT